MACVGVFALRHNSKDMSLPGRVALVRQEETVSAFKCPLFPFVPLVALAINVAILKSFTPATLYGLLIYVLSVITLYFAYSYSHSNLRSGNAETNEDVYDSLRDKVSIPSQLSMDDNVCRYRSSSHTKSSVTSPLLSPPGLFEKRSLTVEERISSFAGA